jgi:integrase
LRRIVFLGGSLPLSHQALAILRQYWVSGSHKADNDARVFDGLGVSHRKKELDEQVGIAHWRLHDLRRTCATGMAELGIQPHIIEAVLNHVSGHKAGVAGIYNRARYESEMRDALQRWADHLDQITGPA